MSSLIAAWGSPCAGKTLLSLKLASEFVRHGQSVILILADPVTPCLPVLQPQKAREHRSLGELLLCPELSQDEILRFCSLYEKNKNLALLGYRLGDNEITYADYSADAAGDLLLMCKHLADVTIVDCFSHLLASALTGVALELADAALRIVNAELKSSVFLESSGGLLAAEKFRRVPCTTVLNNVYGNQSIAPFVEMYGGVRHVMPHLEGLRCQFEQENEGLLHPLTGKDAKKYAVAMLGLLRELEGNDIDIQQ